MFFSKIYTLLKTFKVFSVGKFLDFVSFWIVKVLNLVDILVLVISCFSDNFGFSENFEITELI